MSSAAPPILADPRQPPHAGDDELVRATRQRRPAEGWSGRRSQVAFATAATAFVAGATLCAIFVTGGPRLSWPIAALYVCLYAVVSSIEFEVGTGSAIPTELVLVPMLFALPVGAVPTVVALGLLLKRALRNPLSLRRKALEDLANATYALGPVVVIGLAGGLPLRPQAWPVYVAALAAQFACDFSLALLVSGVAHRVAIGTLSRHLAWIFLVDAALAPVGLAVAFATHASKFMVVLVLPLMLLLRHFSQERKRRIDNALELSDAYRGTAFLLGDVVEADDTYTGAHSRHVVDLVLAVCDECGIAAEDRRDAEFVALLHDVGKIRIPSEIINKAGPLDADEWALMQTHTIEGQQMLERVGGLLAHIGRVVRSCHERWDGAGYPDGLAGEEIPLIARVVSACDAFSAMTTDRPYRRALSHDAAIAELQACAGSQFDPAVVDALVAVAGRY